MRGLTLREAVEKMRGPANSSIVLTVVRQGEDKPLKIKVMRDVIRVQSVKSRVESDIGYIRIASFSEQTMEGLREGDREDQGGDPGRQAEGLRARSARQSRRPARPGGARLRCLHRQGRDRLHARPPADEVQRFSARAGDLTDGKPLIVLINGGSASASEIVAGALQDHRRATLVGTRSFGKGSVQTIIPIGRAGAIRLTTARYYTPSGRSIQAKGIDPDIQVLPEVPKDLQDFDTVSEAELRGHLLGEGEKRAPPSQDAPTRRPTTAPRRCETAAPPALLERSAGRRRASPGALASYVPEDPKHDKQLNYALDLLRGMQVNARVPRDAPSRASRTERSPARAPSRAGRARGRCRVARRASPMRRCKVFRDASQGNLRQIAGVCASARGVDAQERPHKPLPSSCEAALRGVVRLLSRRSSSLLALVVAVVAAFWVAVVDDPDGGRPVAVAKIEEAVPAATGSVAAEAPLQGPPVAAAIEPTPASRRLQLACAAAASASRRGRSEPARIFELRTAAARLARRAPSARSLCPPLGAGAATACARIVIVVGGLGLSQTGTQSAIDALPQDVTLAFAPYGSSLQRWVGKAREAGHEVLLQIPMEPVDYPAGESGRAHAARLRRRRQPRTILHWALGRMTAYAGVMNHMGARFTSDERALVPFLGEIGERGLFYLDDGSSPQSACARRSARRCTCRW